MIKENKIVYYLGIDGGATKTEFVLFDATGNVAKNFVMPSTNPNDIGLEESIKIVSEGVNTCLKEGFTIKGVFAGISGISVGDYKSIFVSKLKNQFEEIEFFADSDIVNVFSCNKKCSLALICGTGSVVFIKNEKKIDRIGGWGYLFDESGSAYDIGKDAIRVTLAAADGLYKSSLVSEMVTAKIDGNIFTKLGEIYKKGKTYIASFSRLVTEAYKMGDETAKEILEKNMKRLAFILETAINKAGDVNVLVGGGVIENCREILVPMLQKHTSANFVFNEFPPIYGACVCCLDKLGINVNENFYNNFKLSYRRQNA